MKAIWFGVAGVTVGLVVGMAMHVAAKDTKAPARPIPLRQIQDDGIEGMLGARLGTIVEVAGKVVPNRSQAKADQSIPFWLSIEKVDGRALKKPVEYSFEVHQFTQVATPKIGDTFRYAGYETGGYSGAVEGEHKYIPPYATVGYGFSTQFEILTQK